MATKQQYTDVAPLVMSIGDFSVSAIENKMSTIPDPPTPPTPPTITKAKIVTIFNLVFDTADVNKGVAQAGGYGEISKTVGLWPSQVKTLVKQLKKMFVLWISEQ